MSNPTDPKKNDTPVKTAVVEAPASPDLNELIDQCKEEQKKWEAKYQRVQFAWATAAAVLTGFILLLRSALFGSTNPPSYGFLAVAAVVVWFCGFIIVLLLEKAKTDPLSAKLNTYKNKAKRNVIPIEAAEKYFAGLATSNLRSLKDYYYLVEEQSDKSFKNASRVGIFGFLLIVAGVIIGLVRGIEDVPIAYISSVAGVITEFISAVFFVIYNRSVAQLKDYHKYLVDLQNLLLAFKIIDDVPVEAEKIKLISKIIEGLINNTSSKLTTQAEPVKPTAAVKPSA
jgi:hypothetical protein